MLLLQRTLVSFYARTLLTDLYIRIIHNRKRTNSVCIITMGLTKSMIFLYEKLEENMRLTKKKIKKTSVLKWTSLIMEIIG